MLMYVLGGIWYWQIGICGKFLLWPSGQLEVATDLPWEKVSLAVKVTVRLDFPIELLVEDRKFPQCIYVSIACKPSP